MITGAYRVMRCLSPCEQLAGATSDLACPLNRKRFDAQFVEYIAGFAQRRRILAFSGRDVHDFDVNVLIDLKNLSPSTSIEPPDSWTAREA